jgi:hypothetical protein
MAARLARGRLTSTRARVGGNGVTVFAPVQETLYRLHQNAWSAWARRRYREDFDRVAAFCLFVGYPRSGHSVVGAMLNAHRDAVIAHELNAPPLILAGCSRDDLYARILARAVWYNRRGNSSNYVYQVPGQWQGRFAALRVIGDKRGGAVTRCLAANPDFLQRVRTLVGVPLRLVHVVRNPFDNIGAISIAEALPLAQSIEFYFAHCQTTARLDALCAPHELITVHHEAMVREPAAVLTDLCGFLGLERYAGYVEDCSRIVFKAPTYTRHRVRWSAAQIRDVEQRARAFPFLAGASFENADASVGA